MITTYQITTFYCILGLVTTGLIGYYPYIDPEGFSSLAVYANHPAKHMTIGKICVMVLMTVQILALILLVTMYRGFNKQFKVSERSLSEKAIVNKAFWIGILSLIVGVLAAKLPWLWGTKVSKGLMSSKLHFHYVGADLIVLCIALVGSGWALETIARHRRWLLQDLGLVKSVDPFIWDIHAQKFNLAKKFLFLGINVWWPYLVLKYAVGMSSLSGLAFLPIHLAGVIPYSILKRKHRFNRTIHPDYKGKISKRNNYVTVNA